MPPENAPKPKPKPRRKRVHSRPLLWWTALASIAIVLAKVLVAGTTLKWGANIAITFGAIDGGLVAALLTPTLGALVATSHAALRDLDGDGKPDAP